MSTKLLGTTENEYVKVNNENQGFRDFGQVQHSSSASSGIQHSKPNPLPFLAARGWIFFTFDIVTFFSGNIFRNGQNWRSRHNEISRFPVFLALKSHLGATGRPWSPSRAIFHFFATQFNEKDFKSP